MKPRINQTQYPDEYQKELARQQQEARDTRNVVARAERAEARLAALQRAVRWVGRHILTIDWSAVVQDFCEKGMQDEAEALATALNNKL